MLSTNKEYLRKRLTQVLEGITPGNERIKSTIEQFLSRYNGQLAQIQVINESIIEYEYGEEMELDTLNGIRITKLYPIYLLTIYY